MMLAAAGSIDVADFLVRLFVDLVAIGIYATMYMRRHARRDLFLVYTAFNIGFFVVLGVITTRHIGVGVGFGLFALLSIIRLRSEPFDNIELGYFFIALSLSLVNGFEHGQYAFVVLLNVILLAAMFLLDHPVFRSTIRTRRVTLDTVETDAAALRRSIAARMGLTIVDIAITEIDYVRETTSITLRYIAEEQTTSDEPAPDDGD